MDVSMIIQHTVFCFYCESVFTLLQKSYLGMLADVPHRTRCTQVHIRVCEERKVSRAPACSQGVYYSFSNKPQNINTCARTDNFDAIYSAQVGFYVSTRCNNMERREREFRLRNVGALSDCTTAVTWLASHY